MTAGHESEWGYNLVGFLSGNFGLGVAARNTLHALHCREERVRLIDLDPGESRRGEAELIESPGTAVGAGGLAVNLFHVNPNEIRISAASERLGLDPVSRLNVAVPFWELPHLPLVGWREILGAMDVVLAPSRYIESAVLEALPDARVLHYPQAVFLPDGIVADRSRFGLPSDATVFFMSMDLTSDPERKNPAGALQAFASAFDGDENVMLAIRLNNPGYSRATRAAHELLARTLGADTRVRVFDEPMSYADVLSLSASTDAYVSLHRSEGLGLNIMEAMSLGKAAIVTAWSGNMDFTDADTALLVDSERIPVEATHPAYAPQVIGPDQVWADPSIASAAWCMRRVHEDREWAAELGRRAQSAMEDRRRAFERGAVFDELRGIRDELAPRIANDTARARTLKAALRDPLTLRARRLVGSGLRRFGLR